MSVWDLSFTARQFVLDFSVVGTLLVLGTIGRRYVPFLQRFLVPSNLVAGFLGLAIGPELLGWIDFSLERMGVYVYHLLALTFIGVGLRRTGGRTVGAVHIGFLKVLTYLLQALIGLGVALLFFWLLSPDLVPAVGMLLPLGFGMGPGIAYSIGQSWGAYGFAEAANIGLTLAALGFLFAYFTGIMVVNRGIRAGRTTHVRVAALDEAMRTGIARAEPRDVGSRLTFFGGAIDTLTFHLALIGAIYLATYGVTLALAELLVLAGQQQELPTLWSFNFILANLLALLTRAVMERLRVAHVLDGGTLNRVTGLMADLLVTTAIMAISLQISWSYLGPIAVMSVLGAGLTYLTIRWAMHRVFPDYAFERTVGLYAEQTGTISSGLAIIRVTDPEFSTPVAQDQVLGSGMALAFGFPLLIVINMPLIRFGGTMEGYGIVVGLLLAYVACVCLLWWLFARRAARRNPGSGVALAD
jgi:ESS family glutamate:Na+ symporter